MQLFLKRLKLIFGSMFVLGTQVRRGGMCKKTGFRVIAFLLCIFITSAFGALQIDPSEGFLSAGPEGGPFEPSQKTYTLTNTGQSSLYWGAEENVSWLQCSPEWGLLAAGNSVEVTVSINSTAESLAAGEYQENIIFTDISSGLDYTRTAVLTVTSNVSGPVAWWKLDGDATDSSGNNHHGTINGDPNWIAQGIVNGAVRLQQEQDYFTINDYKGILGGDSRTTSAWIKIAPAVTNEAIILSWGTSETGKLWSFRARTYWDDPSESKIEVGVWGGAIRGSTRLNDNQWHHVAAVLRDDGSANLSEVRLFVDGIQESTIVYNYQGSIPDVVTAEGQEVFIGQQLVPDLDPFWFNGSMDDVRIYNRALSQAEILILINNGPLQVTPRDTYTSSGEPGGPFSPSYKDYTIKNLSNKVLYWGIDPLPEWLDSDIAFGSLDPNESTVVRVFLTEAADLLEEGLYTSALTIYNLSTVQEPVIRNINLDVHYIRGIWASPEAFEVDLVEGNQLQDLLTIGNNGTETLNFAIRSRTVVGPASAAAQQESSLQDSTSNNRPQKKIQDVKKALKQEHKKDEVLVRFAPDQNRKYPDKEKQKQKLSQILPKSSIIKQFTSVPGLNTVKLPPNISVQDALLLLNARQDVLYVHPNYRVYADGLPNDTRFGELWGLHNTGQSDGTSDADIDAPEAWDISMGSESVVVAVIDTGVDYNHEDLAANMWTNLAEKNGTPGVDDDQNGFIDDIYGYDFCNYDPNPMDDHYHGTHCAGTIAAVGNNGKGVTGVCWNVKIMALKFLDAGGSGWTDDAVECVEYATLMGAKVMSNSWGGGAYAQALKDAIDAAGAAGIAFVAAAGNDGVSNDTYPHYPSSYTSDNLIAVLATDRYDNRSSFSNYGLVSVDLGAPGSSILSCQPGNRYQFLNGTSMATPHVSGACAMLWSANPSLTVSEVKDILLNTADPLTVLAGKCVSGGRLNLNDALLETSTPWISFDIEQGQLEPGQSTPINVTFDAAGLAPGHYQAEIIIISDDAAHPQLTIPVSLTVLPDDLIITPESAFEPNGIEGGPFLPAFMTYTLENTGTESLQWQVEWLEDWVTVEPAVGILQSGQTFDVTVSVNENADLLEPGIHEAMLSFLNLRQFSTRTRSVVLKVRPPDKFTEVFTADFDLAYHSIMLRPDSVTSYYVSCVESELIQQFYTDPANGTFVPLGDDDCIEVLLSGGKQVQLYGQSYDRVYVGSNGYLTFGQGDSEHEPTIENHFKSPRIASLFTDLTPVNSQSIAYQQIDDRFVVTYNQVPVFGNKTSSNTFQIELFFADGAIRISYLGVDALSAIVGLSEGLGRPGLFEESDFSSYLKCCNCGDLDGDSQVELSDLCEFAAAWLQAECTSLNWCGRTDFDKSGQVDFADLIAISENWQKAEYAWSQPEFLLELNGKTWTQPQYSSELDDSQGNKATSPTLTRDALKIYFARYVPSLGHVCIIEASRTVPVGSFVNERVLTEIATTHLKVINPWISADGQRLYYRETLNGNTNEAVFKMAEWSESLNQWIPNIRVFNELTYGLGYADVELSLTEDELTVVWQSNRPGGTGNWDVWTASRSSADQPFGSIRQLAEINTLENDGGPSISPDGLTLYFHSSYRADSDTGSTGIYKATRSTLSEPFGNIACIKFPGYATMWEHNPYFDFERNVLYFQNTDAGGISMTTCEPHPNQLPAGHPNLSFDELTMFYNRTVPELGYKCIFRKTRSSVTEPFGPEEMISELIQTGSNLGSPWLSKDGQRLYYHETHLSTAESKMKLAVWSPEDNRWYYQRTLDEIHYGPGTVSILASLTEDELEIFWCSTRPDGTGNWGVWTASRSAITNPFENIHQIAEINTTNTASPSVSPDGLTLYFNSSKNGSTQDIYRVTRTSRNDPFGNIVLIDLFRDETVTKLHPYVTADGKKIYFEADKDGQSGCYFSEYAPRTEPCIPK